jgi:hypothetical protein
MVDKGMCIWCRQSVAGGEHVPPSVVVRLEHSRGRSEQRARLRHEAATKVLVQVAGPVHVVRTVRECARLLHERCAARGDADEPKRSSGFIRADLKAAGDVEHSLTFPVRVVG